MTSIFGANSRCRLGESYLDKTPMLKTPISIMCRDGPNPNSRHSRRSCQILLTPLCLSGGPRPV